MNKYLITTFSCGNSQETIVAAYDIMSALSMVPTSDIVKIEFIGSTNKIDMTEGL